MFNLLIKNLSILKKFLFINLVIFIIIGTFTIIYLKSVQPNLINKKTRNHIQIINNTIDHIQRLKIEFNNDDIRKFLFSTRFLFQNLDRVILFDSEFNLVGDTDTLDLDPRSFSQRLDVIELEVLNKEKTMETSIKKKVKKDKIILFNNILQKYSNSKDFGKTYSFTQENYNQFLLTTIKNVNINGKNIGFLVISENANDIRAAIDERKSFIIRTAIVVALVILIFSIVLNRYFLKPIKNLVIYTKIIKDKSKKETNIENLKNRDDEIGTLSESLDDMTNELQKRINTAENFSTDLVHEIRNPLASLKSASEIISETTDKAQREKLVNILLHDVERIERLITDYSQMLKDEASLSREKMLKVNLMKIILNVVEDFRQDLINQNKSIEILTNFSNKEEKNYFIIGIENRLEQVIANLLDNAISFSNDQQTIEIDLTETSNNFVMTIKDQGPGFTEASPQKIFKRFYSNRPSKFGEHSGLGLNIAKNIVELHKGAIAASNRINQKGAQVEVLLPKILS